MKTPQFTLFLDCDGVLAVDQDRRQHMFRKFSEGPARRLKRLLEAVPNLDIVISSTWRKTDLDWAKLQRSFAEYALPWERIKGVTGKRNDGQRGLEIKEYAEAHNIPPHLRIILDDEVTDMGKVSGVIFKVDWNDGLTEEMALGIEAYIKGTASLGSAQ